VEEKPAGGGAMMPELLRKRAEGEARGIHYFHLSTRDARGIGGEK